jgi:hypothetical protein
VCFGAFCRAGQWGRVLAYKALMTLENPYEYLLYLDSGVAH